MHQSAKAFHYVTHQLEITEVSLFKHTASDRKSCDDYIPQIASPPLLASLPPSFPSRVSYFDTTSGLGQDVSCQIAGPKVLSAGLIPELTNL